MWQCPLRPVCHGNNSTVRLPRPALHLSTSAWLSARISNEEALRMLGVTGGASKQELKRAFVMKAKALHPDVNPSKEAASQFAALNEAFQTLQPLAKDAGESDPELDADYARFREWADRRRRQRELDDYVRGVSVNKLLVLAAATLVLGQVLVWATERVSTDNHYRRAWGSRYDEMLLDFKATRGAKQPPPESPSAQ